MIIGRSVRFSRNLSNRTMLKVAEFDVHSIYHFYAIKNFSELQLKMAPRLNRVIKSEYRLISCNIISYNLITLHLKIDVGLHPRIYF